MAEFLILMSRVEALSRWFAAFPEISPIREQIGLAHALGRINASPICAPHGLPEFPRSAMDGYAVRAADTFGASEGLPAYLSVVGEAPMGSQPGFSLGSSQAALIHTGGMLPAGADGVVMLENTQAARTGEVEVLRAVAPGENLIQAGEDVAVGQVVIPAGTRLRPAHIGGLAALGVLRVEVSRQPRIAVISSGDEVVPPDQTPAPGQVRDVNGPALCALIEESGASANYLGILRDEEAVMDLALRQALRENDAVVISAGSSASTRDLTARAIQKAGAPGVLVHGVNVRPGKPTILAVCDGKPVLGLPGNPLSALIIARLFITPMLDKIAGLATGSGPLPVRARLTLNLATQAGREDWLPVLLRGEQDELRAEPVFFKSNLIFALARADGLLFIPPNVTGLSAGEWADVYPF
jgi:molybdopterin molybdotransferase